METKLNRVARPRIVLLCLAINLLLITGCNKEDLSPPKPASIPTNSAGVWMQNGAFMPSSLTVTPNTIVQWTNRDYASYTVTSNTQLFNSGYLTKGASYTHLFSGPGVYPYYSSTNSQMTGTITVLAIGPTGSTGVTGSSGSTGVTGVSGVTGAQP